MKVFGGEGVEFKPVEDLDLSPDSDEVYVAADVKAPRMDGLAIKIFTWILESKFLGALLAYILKKANLFHKFISFAELKEPPVFVPSHCCNVEYHEEQEVKSVQPVLSPPELVQEATDCLPLFTEEKQDIQTGFKRWTIQDYSRAYVSDQTTPTMVAMRFLEAVRESSSPHLNMSFFINYNSEDILKQAVESAIRYDKGQPISILDGVPIAIKDEIDCTPYPTTGGTKWLHKLRCCTEDARCVKNLRSCGAIIVGKTNMHELGAGTSGINPHYGAARNPYDPRKISGGSSSGSAALVSAGLCPAALGVDGGGSVRMPAALCGVLGLKPTFGRVSHSGVLPLNWTVGMVGVLAGTVEDALIVYAAISGQLPSKQLPLLWFNDCSNDIKKCCDHALDQLCKHHGWKIVEVTIPEIEVMRLAHYLTIGSECSTSLSSHLKNLKAKELGFDTRVALCLYKSFSGKEYLTAQRIRRRQIHIYEEIFKQADVIVTPTTGVTAYPITADALKYGEFDYINGAALVRYQIAGNFLGLPAVSVPVGYDEMGMPIGLQFIGRPWSEATLIHMAFTLQGLCISSYRKPKVFYDLLGKA